MPRLTTNTIILNVFDKWWRMEVRDHLDAGSMTMKPNVPTSIMSQATVIYNATTKKMIKNRWGGESLNDAMLLRLWLNDQLPIFEYKSHTNFMKQRTNFLRRWYSTEPPKEEFSDLC